MGSTFGAGREINLPESLVVIQRNAFGSLSDKTKIRIPKNVKFINGNIFKESYYLGYTYVQGYLNVDEENIYYESAEGGGIIDKRRNELITGTAYTKLTSNITRIGSYAFYGLPFNSSVDYPKIKSVIIPSNIIEIGEYAFSRLYNIKEVFIHANIKTIPRGCFSRSLYINKVVLPDSIIEIKEYAFYDSDLQNITLPKKLEIIREEAFGYTNLEKTVIPRSVNIIERNAFYNCTNNHIGTIIFAEATSKPEGWDTLFNPNNSPVFWYSETENNDGHHWRYVDGEPTPWQIYVF